MTKKKVVPKLYLGIEGKYLAKNFPTEWKEYQGVANKWYNSEPSAPYRPSAPQKTIEQNISIAEISSYISIADLLDLCTQKEVPIAEVSVHAACDKYDNESYHLVIKHSQEVPNPNLVANQKYYDDQMIIYNKKLIEYEKANATFQIKRDRITELMKLFDKSLEALLK